MKFRWVLRDLPAPEAVPAIRKVLNDLPEPLARALVLRGIDTFERARTFFRPSMDMLHDPFQLADMDAAADRIVTALDRSERIVVYGDYDVDGTTATALLVSSLRRLGAPVDFFVPDRFEDGYGLSESGLDQVANRGADLLISVDCGVTAIEEALYVRSLGIDLIVCDHHTPLAELPKAVAVLDPKRSDCPYPFPSLSGCAVAFKLLQAVHRRLDRDPTEAFEYLDLVAIATASDIVPVQGENRVLLRYGLERIQNHARLGVRALAHEAGRDLTSCTATDIVFAIGPRINAAGRLRSASRAVELLLAEDPSEAARLARSLEELNQKRRDMDSSVLESAVRQAERQLTSKTRHALVLHQDDWHLGVIGIVASRLVERFYKPTILLGTNNGVAKGSARSIAGINIYDALKSCSDLLLEFGGHDYAAGMSLRIEDVPALSERLNDVVGAAITPELLEPAIHVDARLPLDEIDDRFWAVLKQFAPYGPTNDQPVFQSERLRLARPPRTVGRDGTHLKFALQRDHGAPLDAIGFGLGKHADLLETSHRSGHTIDVLFSIEENTWNGRTSLQLKARDIRASVS